MEEVGPVLVGMNHPLVFVPMCVAGCSGQAGMIMVVVIVVVAMDVFVAQGLVHVDMNVALQQEKRYRGDE